VAFPQPRVFPGTGGHENQCIKYLGIQSRRVTKHVMPAPHAVSQA
jgi:hypothetical protein